MFTVDIFYLFSYRNFFTLNASSDYLFNIFIFSHALTKQSHFKAKMTLMFQLNGRGNLIYIINLNSSSAFKCTLCTVVYIIVYAYFVGSTFLRVFCLYSITVFIDNVWDLWDKWDARSIHSTQSFLMDLLQDGLYTLWTWILNTIRHV